MCNTWNGGVQASLPDKFSLQLSEPAPKHAVVHCKSGKKINDKG
jgi:hypothetical protein